MQEILLFVFYMILFSFLVCKAGFIKRSGLANWWLIGLFCIKVLAGLAYAWFYRQPGYYATSDTWHFFELSKGETDWLLRDPPGFFKDIFVSGYDQNSNLFLGENSYWNDLKSNLIIKLVAIANVFTFKSYYADIVFFNFCFFFGPVALYRVIKELFTVNKLVLIAGAFLIPSCLFWCSGIHKDGIIVTCTAVTAFLFYSQLKKGRPVPAAILVQLLLMAVLFASRNFMAILLLGSLIAWLLCHLYPRRKKWMIPAFVAAALAVFFLSGSISAATDLPAYIITKQSEFKMLSGTSSIPVPNLENNILSFIKFLPTALDIALFRPHVTEIKNISYIPAVAEIILFWTIAAAAVFIPGKIAVTDAQQAFVIFCLFFSFSFLLLAGYTITFSGAIVRYKASILPFLFVPVMLKISALISRFYKPRIDTIQ